VRAGESIAGRRWRRAGRNGDFVDLTVDFDVGDEKNSLGDTDQPSQHDRCQLRSSIFIEIALRTVVRGGSAQPAPRIASLQV